MRRRNIRMANLLGLAATIANLSNKMFHSSLVYAKDVFRTKIKYKKWGNKNKSNKCLRKQNYKFNQRR